MRRWISCAASLASLGAAVAIARPAAAQDRSSGGFFAEWQHRATVSQAEQPRWITPLFTTTPRLEQEFRYDNLWRYTPTNFQTTVYTNGKGLELIPLSPIEVIIGVPSYVVHHNPKAPDGWGDWPLLIKYRIVSGNATHGNYILTAFLGATLPTGGVANGADHTIVTPTIAGGKGFGNFDIQATLGVNIPSGNTEAIGHPVLYNATAQYHIGRFLWPEVEVNGTAWRDGTLVGRNQVFITPGIVFGRFPIHDRLGFTIGGGVQIAATKFRQFDHDYALSVRMPF